MISVGVGSPDSIVGPVVVGRLNAKPLDLGQVSWPLTLRFQGESNDTFPRADIYFGYGCLVLSALSSELLQSGC